MRTPFKRFLPGARPQEKAPGVGDPGAAPHLSGQGSYSLLMDLHEQQLVVYPLVCTIASLEVQPGEQEAAATLLWEHTAQLAEKAVVRGALIHVLAGPIFGPAVVRFLAEGSQPGTLAGYVTAAEDRLLNALKGGK